MTSNVYVKIEDNPLITGFEPDFHAGLPTEAILGTQNKQVDNYGVNTQDPANWFVFDPGKDGRGAIGPNQVATIDAGGTIIPLIPSYRGVTDFQAATTSPIPAVDLYLGYGTDSQLFDSGGPRNLGYAQIGNKTFYKINKYVASQNYYGAQVNYEHTDAWKTGSIELTIKPEKSNCYLISGTSFPDNAQAFSFTEEYRSPGKSVYFVQIDGQLAEFVVSGGDAQISAYPNGYVKENNIVLPDESKGYSLQSTTEIFRTFALKLVNGILVLTYQKHYADKKLVEIVGKTNLVDGNWHHVVINKPGQFDTKVAELEYEGEGCIEIWVDGKLEMRSFEITQNDPLPSPRFLFNNSLNSGILNWHRFQTPTYSPWVYSEIEKDGYVGGVRDYIFRQQFALDQNAISLNHVYALKNTDAGKINKVKRWVATAKMIEPTITSNKPKILKLYWDNLLSNKEKMLDGVELDEEFDVYSYSVTKKNLINPSKTFNLDLNSNVTTERFYLPNVVAAVGRHVFIGSPGVQLQSAFDGLQIDPLNDAKVAAQSGLGSAIFINNILFGGVSLKDGDNILLFNQPKKANNGIWTFNGFRVPLTRPRSISPQELKNAHVYVNEGKYAGKTFIQTEKVTSLRKSTQEWYEIDTNSNIVAPDSYPIHYSSWTDNYGNQSFIDVNNDVDLNYDIIAFMNYPSESSDIVEALFDKNEILTLEKYQEFIANIKTAVYNGKKIIVNSPMLAKDLGIVSKYIEVPQLTETTDAQAAAISPFENGESASNYFDTHRNNRYRILNTINGLTDKSTYIMTDFVYHKPSKDYHIKYLNRSLGLFVNDEFMIPGLTTIEETTNENLPGYWHNQKKTKNLIAFDPADILIGTAITGFANTYYSGSNAVQNEYKNYVTTIAGNYGSGKIFVNCVENGYAFSRSDYNTGRIQNVTINQNAETALTAAWQYSTKRLNKKSVYDFSDNIQLVGQTSPTNGGGGPIVQSQSHCSNGFIRKKTNINDLQYQSDLYVNFEEEFFNTTEIPVYSMTWLGLKWLGG